MQNRTSVIQMYQSSAKLWQNQQDHLCSQHKDSEYEKGRNKVCKYSIPVAKFVPTLCVSLIRNWVKLKVSEILEHLQF